MAYRRSHGKGRAKKIEPAVQTLLFQGAASSSATEHFYIDLSQCASLVNRRFYRQGINWAVSGIKILTQDFAGQVYVMKLPETWVMSNAWEKGFRAWQKMNKQALEEAPTTKPKFLDFKIYADHTHFEDGFSNNLLPTTLKLDDTVGTASAGEWVSSKIVVPNTDDGATGGVKQFEIMAVGANYNGAAADVVSLIDGYAAGRALPARPGDPNVPDDMSDADGPTPENWLSAMFNEGTQQDDEVLNDMRTENNEAPYPYENDGTNDDTMYPGGANQLPALQVHDFDLMTPTTVGGTTYIKGGQFPCGLIKIVAAADEGTVPALAFQIDLVPGHHRGYLCEPMTEM